MNKSLRIACDGEAASGKSTGAKLVSKKYKLFLINSGLLYRYASKIIIKHKPKKIVPFLKKKFKNISYNKIKKQSLHSQEISNHVGYLAKNKVVRDNLLTYQREFAIQDGGTVLDGRDIGTVVCPNADIKIFVDADIEIRAKRRYNQYRKNNSNLNLRDIIDDLTKRDYLDKNRLLSPLVSAKDAYLLDTSNITSEDGLKKIIQIISRKLEK